MFNKNGLSTIVATISLVLITIVAAGIIAGIVVPLVKTQLNDAKECFGYEDYFTFYEDFEYNCRQNSSQSWLQGISVKADSVSEEKAENVKGFKLHFLGDGSSESADVEEGKIIGEIRMLNSSITHLEVPVQGEVRTYVYESDKVFDFIEIYPVMKSGRVCDETDRIDIRGAVCNPSINL